MTGSTILTLHDPSRSKAFYGAGYWQKDTLYTLLRKNAVDAPDSAALRDGQRRLTWSQLLGMVEAVAAELDGVGLRRGDRVAAWLPNCIEVVAILLACSRNEYVCCSSFHHNYSVVEVIGLMKRIDAAAFFGLAGYGGDRDGAVFDAARDLASMKRVCQILPKNCTEKGAAAFSTFPARCHPSHESVPETHNPDKIVCLAFTSGTTGEPKGVLHSDNTLLCNARSLIEDWQHPADTVLLSLSPMTHAIGTIAVGQALVGGFELVLNMPRDSMSTLDWILETGATYVMGVPTHAIDVMAEMDRRKLDRMGSVRVFYMGGAAVSSETIATLKRAGVQPQNVYGMTENLAHQYTCPGDDEATMVRTCGRSSRGYEVRIWDSENPDVEAVPGEVGEIGGKGACLMLGYFSDQRATELSFNRAGWFMSGDLGRIDDAGCLEVVGRKKDTVIRGGKNIYPLAIEAIAARFPGILKVAVFPIPDKRLGERICLAAIPRDSGPLDLEGLMAFLRREGLAIYNMPEFYIEVEAFPMTPSGKVLKRALTQQVSDGTLVPSPVKGRA